ncbi:MAG: 4Fe-4S binding protein [Clostridia bacterium]|nr:4Fe-4S binding protein [Clostridia bacterium]
MKKFFAKLKSLIPTKRRLIQLYAALLTNANLKGFVNGKIYQGPTKNGCVPGLNCYSCPGASGACPLGSLQNALASSGKSVPFYIFGIIMLYGIILGRTICGFLCPFGLVQDLLYKIKTPKLGKSRFTKILSYLKYVILVLLVVVFPLIYMLRDVPLPSFCKYICPAGTLGGAMGLLANAVNDGMFSMLGSLFTWKFAVLVVIIVACIFIYRAFCRFLCPLGALYGLFNRFSFLGITLERPKCTDCGRCITVCKMDITSVGDMECISCGECISECPTQAIRYKGGKIILPDNEIPELATEEEKAVITEKRKKRVTILKIVAAVVAVAVIAGSLVYYNFIDAPAPDVGVEIGNACPTDTLDRVGEDGTFDTARLRGRVTIINFWGTWCTPCVQELPHFDEVAAEYDGEVSVVAIHSSSSYGMGEPEDYIAEHYPDSKMIFLRDVIDPDNPYADKYYSALGGVSTYPMTLVLDEYGIIVAKYVGSVTYDQLVAAIAEAQQ